MISKIGLKVAASALFLAGMTIPIGTAQADPFDDFVACISACGMEYNSYVQSCIQDMPGATTPWEEMCKMEGRLRHTACTNNCGSPP